MRRAILRFALALVATVTVVAAGLWLTRAQSDGPEALAGLTGNAAAGQQIFTASGCASCHHAPGATGTARLVLSGGQHFPSPFGTFTAPNISPDKQAGIGGWSALDLWNALNHGTSPDGRHYYPAFPYASFVHMTPQQVVDLYAYLTTLPADATPSGPHELPFPFNIRAGLGLWKLIYLRDDWVMPGSPGDLGPQLARGRVLVEAFAHCGECHSPRTPFGGMRKGAAWLSGAPNPAGRGRFPDLTAPKMTWSADELVEYFTSGFTPDYDSAGGDMAEVVDNLSHLPESDRAAIAAYLKRLPLGN